RGRAARLRFPAGTGAFRLASYIADRNYKIAICDICQELYLPCFQLSWGDAALHLRPVRPRPGKELQLRDELMRVLEPTRAEPGWVRIHLYESTREPLFYFIHSEWIDERAFDAHAELPHIRRFLGLVDDLITHPLQAVRTKQIG